MNYKHKTLIEYHPPVSYTHLDVYKRQGEACGRNRRLESTVDRGAGRFEEAVGHPLLGTESHTRHSGKQRAAQEAAPQRSLAAVSYTHLANMSKEGKHISMDTLARIGETLNCEITDVIELVPDEPASTGGKEHERIETKNNGKRN